MATQKKASLPLEGSYLTCDARRYQLRGAFAIYAWERRGLMTVEIGNKLAEASSVLGLQEAAAAMVKETTV